MDFEHSPEPPPKGVPAREWFVEPAETSLTSARADASLHHHGIDVGYLAVLKTRVANEESVAGPHDPALTNEELQQMVETAKIAATYIKERPVLANEYIRIMSSPLIQDVADFPWHEGSVEFTDNQDGKITFRVDRIHDQKLQEVREHKSIQVTKPGASHHTFFIETSRLVSSPAFDQITLQNGTTTPLHFVQTPDKVWRHAFGSENRDDLADQLHQAACSMQELAQPVQHEAEYIAETMIEVANKAIPVLQHVAKRPTNMLATDKGGQSKYSVMVESTNGPIIHVAQGGSPKPRDIGTSYVRATLDPVTSTLSVVLRVAGAGVYHTGLRVAFHTSEDGKLIVDKAGCAASGQTVNTATLQPLLEMLTSAKKVSAITLDYSDKSNITSAYMPY